MRGRPLRAEFALSTVATVTRVIARYARIFLHTQADRVGICDHLMQ